MHALDWHLANRTHVVSGRVGFSYVNNEAGERVPFYFLAYVGGVDTIRSFREFRFKDENAMWLSAESNALRIGPVELPPASGLPSASATRAADPPRARAWTRPR